MKTHRVLRTQFNIQNFLFIWLLYLTMFFHYLFSLPVTGVTINIFFMGKHSKVVFDYLRPEIIF